jgi:hypothetical protein
LLEDRVGEGWLRRLRAVYEVTDGLAHAPRPIPAAACSGSPIDVGLSEWHVVADGRSTVAMRGDTRGSARRHAAYVAKVAGDHSTARWHAVRAVLEQPRCWESWRLLAATMLGPIARRARALAGREVSPA